MSRLVADNIDNLAAVPAVASLKHSLVTSEPPVILGPILVEVPEPWSTPRKTTDLARQLAQFNPQPPKASSQQQLFRKVRKAFDNIEHSMATLQMENQVLRVQLEVTKPRKRTKVETDPNTFFIGIKDVRKAQIEAGAARAGPVDSSEDEEFSDTGSCIVVGGKSRNGGV